ncbi:putative motility protein [Pleomorphomonas sp. JP5]|uniref:putative motility protein n=1 Tax=Pleomorphomonas sp. JP5 TaxID=2942998 RepID=UPI002043E612|nr:putative motility protein [Pleomorphomonas sp. JP5]MCM5559521.1 putative motility protein [Pleomorphomonas sp. JP5]
MDIAATASTMLQASTKSDLGMAVMKMALKSDQSAADLLSQAAESAASAPPPAGMGNHVDMTV